MTGKDPIVAKSVRALADLLGKGPSTVRKWTHDPRWPFPKHAPYTREQVRLIREWSKMYLTHDPAAAWREAAAGDVSGRPVSEMERRKLAYLTVRAKLLYQRLQVEEGKLHRTDECLRLHAAIVHKGKASLLNLGRSLRNALIGQDGDGIEKIINERVYAILKDLENDN